MVSVFYMNREPSILCVGCMYVCMCCLTPNLRRTSPPRENTTRGHPLAISYLLSPARPATNHTRPTSRLDRQVGRFRSTTSNSVPRRSRPHAPPPRRGCSPCPSRLRRSSVSVSGPENPCFGSRSHGTCDRSCSPEKEQNQNFSTFVPRAQTSGRHARDREGGGRGVRETRLEAGHRYGG